MVTISPLREADPLEECAAETHHRRALDLVHEVVGVDDRTAVERRDELRDPTPSVER